MARRGIVMRIMFAQDRIKRAVKPLLFADDERVRRIKRGPALGVLI